MKWLLLKWENIWYWMSQIWTLAISGFTMIFGGQVLTVEIWIALIILDFITGIARSIKNKVSITSAIMREKTFQKLIAYLIPLLVLLLVVKVVECTIPLLLTSFLFLQNLIILGYIINEGISVLENTSELAPQLHMTKSLLKFLKRKQKTVEEQIAELCEEDEDSGESPEDKIDKDLNS